MAITLGTTCPSWCFWMCSDVCRYIDSFFWEFNKKIKYILILNDQQWQVHKNKLEGCHWNWAFYVLVMCYTSFAHQLTCRQHWHCKYCKLNLWITFEHIFPIIFPFIMLKPCPPVTVLLFILGDSLTSQPQLALTTPYICIIGLVLTLIL